jgi:hypothetical protein
MLQSCNEDELEATVPAYIKIDDISVNITDPIQGSASDKITDAWVYINDRLIGAFELPTLVPVLQTGNINIKIRGGIFNNGLSNQREIYPFYDFYELDTTLLPEEILDSFPDANGIVQDKPFVEYQPRAIFDEAWEGEDFESGINFIVNPSSDTNIVRITDQNLVFEGNASGAIFLPSGTTFAEIYSPSFSSFEIPTNGTAVYMELNYKSTHDFSISLYTDNRSRQFSVVNFRASAGWNKAYVEFSNVFSSLFSSSNFNIAVGLRKPINENTALYLDNFKLINY